MSDFLFYDRSEGSVETFNSEKEAVSYAKEHIRSYLTDGDGWLEDSDMTDMCVYRVIYRPIQKNLQSREEWEKENCSEDWYNDDWSYLCDYELTPVSEPQAKDALIKELIKANEIYSDECFYESDYCSKLGDQTPVILDSGKIAREVSENKLYQEILKGMEC